jgi:predicted hotdog family 3-hydroxylacyl-ACP dehydratase
MHQANDTVGSAPSVEELIPHRGAMRLVEAVLSRDARQTTARAQVRPAWPLGDGRSVNAVVLVELIAQTAAIAGGQAGEDNRGFLVGLREARFFRATVDVGTELVVEAQIVGGAGELVVFAGAVRTGDELLCTAQIQVVRVKSE